MRVQIRILRETGHVCNLFAEWRNYTSDFQNKKRWLQVVTGRASLCRDTTRASTEEQGHEPKEATTPYHAFWPEGPTATHVNATTASHRNFWQEICQRDKPHDPVVRTHHAGSVGRRSNSTHRNRLPCIWPRWRAARRGEIRKVENR
jgi:hypothetical protein